MTLEQFFTQNPKVALGFSGGVDSSYLLYAGIKYGAEIKAYHVKAAFQPEFELQDAKKLASSINANMQILEIDVMSDENVLANPANRCYICKQVIFGTLKAKAIADGFSVIIDGTNASDDVDDRPGMKALTELSVRSPLREAGLSKDEIRRLSKEAKLFTWNKPSYACLATRIPTGRKITQELLTAVEKSEDALFKLGFNDFRVRVYNDAARIQLPANQMEAAINKRANIKEALKPHFPIILLDLEER